jgi:pimeloyl-ACP methyl ester carboxylesterase
MARRARLFGIAAVAAGGLAGAAMEEVLYRRVLRRRDPEADEPIGSVPGTTQWIESFDGTRLYARAYGPNDGPGSSVASIVFAHGFVENHVIWHYLIRDLRADGRFHLVAYDARGHGNSGPAKGRDGTTAFDSHTLGADLAAVIDQATTGPVVVVGHSLGGMTALSRLVLERKERERVAGGVLVNSTFTAELAGWRGKGTPANRSIELVGDLLRRAAGDDAKRIDRVRTGVSDAALLIARTIFGKDPSPRHIAVGFHMFETTSSQTLAAAFDLADFDVHAQLSSIDVPMLIIAGSRDVLTPAFLSKEMAKHIPDAELVVLDGCGHMAPFERHDEVVAHIRKFAERVLP